MIILVTGNWYSFMSAQRKRWTIDDVKALAKSKGGKLLTNEYLGWRGTYRWQCAKGHMWESNLTPVAVGNKWCRECTNGSDAWIRRLSDFAENKGGKCLSHLFTNAKTKLRWKCQVGHTWEATSNNILNGRWCPTCGRAKVNDGRRRTLADLQLVAHERSGECLSETVPNVAAKVKWKCANGHEWLASGSSVLAGSWCQQCGYESAAVARRSKTKFDEVKDIALERGGKCLSEEYLSIKRPLKFQCHNGHQWSAAPSDIVGGRWCPYCSAGRGERIVREYFEQLFDCTFPRARPDWLRSPRGTRYELDGYCEDLKLAFEHHGAYHYHLKSRYSTKQSDLDFRQVNDLIKRELCRKYGVTLIEVPEVPSMTTLPELHALIISEAQKAGISVPEKNLLKDVDLTAAYQPESMYTKLQESAHARGGTLLNESYLGKDVPLSWECRSGHRWESTPASVYWAKSWCPICSGTKKKTLEDMHALALSRGGKLLSTEFHSVRTPIQWQCGKGHIWEATPTSLTNRGSWCPYCAGQKGEHLRIERMREVAIERGGKCLSEVYVNSKTKLRWQCAHGHQWDAIPLNVINKGSWCRKCFNNKRRSLLIETIRGAEAYRS